MIMLIELFWNFNLLLKGGKCFCFDNLESTSVALSNKDCSTRCPGDPGQMCGGQGTLSVFNFRYNDQRKYLN